MRRMAMIIPVAGRYARALLDVAGKDADRILGELEALGAYFEANASMFQTASSQVLDRTMRRRFVESLVQAIPELHPKVANLLRVLAERDRIGAFLSIVACYREYVDERLGRARCSVTSAWPLSDEQLAELTANLEKITRRKVVMTTAQDAKLLGGAVVRVGTMVYDGSIRAQLEALGRHLAPTARG